ncbi:ATP phosphoribosyltransferase [Pseudoxanthobacter sp.]|uniref:ATP phosphoribosyltransferase n=1 Tax=Pseudoxanthobacter sp. TaxID=1925742 RepID=UPI002FE0BC14
MSGPLIIAIPSKGRLQENTQSFFARAGLPFVQAGGARGYRGSVKGVEGVEIAFLSASEIAREIAGGGVHLGVTGLDLVHESIPEPVAREQLIHRVLPLGFGHADVVVAVPKAWIDVRSMADLADVATDFRVRHGRWMRVATKYIHLARSHFAAHDISDYRIVESLGATEGAPAAGSAELVIDITTTGSTLEANALKIIDDGVILRSEAHLLASRKAAWSGAQRAAVRIILDRIAAEARARTVRELRTRVADGAQVVRQVRQLFECVALSGGEGGELVLHVPAARVFDCAAWLKGHGASTVSVSALSQVFEPVNPMVDRLTAALG